MDKPSIGKPIAMTMVKNLLRGVEVHADRNVLESNRWPGPHNLIRLSNAVYGKSPFVLFGNGSRFNITYNDTNVLIKPSTGDFAPMGFFSYKQLAEVRDAAKVGAI